jgi:uncharacterized membrane protein YbaN (DUF454 family)
MSENEPRGSVYWRHIVGWPLLILGIVGLALPFLQGILFIVVALILLAPEIPLFRRVLEALKKRFPAVFEKAAQVKSSLRRKFGQP